jgi:hypothetical protein
VLCSVSLFLCSGFYKGVCFVRSGYVSLGRFVWTLHIVFRQESRSCNEDCAVHIQNVPGGKFNNLGDHSIGHSKQKIVYVHVSYSERFPR